MKSIEHNRETPRVGFLVVGLGFLGTQRALAIARRDDTRLIAVHDRDESRSRALAGRLGAIAVSDFQSALAHPEVDAVVVATPHADHFSQVRQALRAGKHVLCEKPLAIDPDDARELVELAAASGVRLATGYNHRFLPPVYDALELVQDGAIGAVETVRVVIGHRASPAFLESWHTNVEISGGGTLIDNGTHACDLIRCLLGEVVSAQGRVRGAVAGNPRCEREAYALFRTVDDRVAELRSSWSLESGYLTMEIRGERGFLDIETAPWQLGGKLVGDIAIDRAYFGRRLQEKFGRFLGGYDQSLSSELAEFADLASVPSKSATGWDGYRASEMIRAVYESSRSGREIALDAWSNRGASRRILPKGYAA